MLIWGGEQTYSIFCNASGYDRPAANARQSLTVCWAPAARAIHAAVWTGTKILIKGGGNSSTNFNETAAYTLPPDHVSLSKAVTRLTNATGKIPGAVVGPGEIHTVRCHS